MDQLKFIINDTNLSSQGQFSEQSKIMFVLNGEPNLYKNCKMVFVFKRSREESAIATNEEFAWPHFMSTLTGNEWINCGCSGCNVLTWHTYEIRLPTAQTKDKVQAYIIGLIINYVLNTDRSVELGTIDDIGADCTITKTYYAGLSSIIRNLNDISPNTKIFVNNCPKTGDKYTLCNQAVRDIVNAYKDIYPVHCIDFESIKEYYENLSFETDYVNGHYTDIGYEQFAEIYEYVLSDYINNHVSEFQNIHEIDYQ